MTANTCFSDCVEHELLLYAILSSYLQLFAAFEVKDSYKTEIGKRMVGSKVTK